MVVSPEYACQLVFVVNDAAVLNARCGGFTAPNFCGLNGRKPCTRWMRYSSSMATTLNNSMAKAYSVQRISWSSSTPVTRYSRRSTGRSTGSMNVRSRLNTRVRKTPMGLVTARIRARNTMIWNHPLAVMSELLRSQQCVEEINHHQRTNDHHDCRFDMHRFLT